MSANIAVYAVLLLFVLILIACTILIVSWKLRRQINERLDRPIRERLAGLPSSVVLDTWPPAAPARGRERRVARDMVIEATGALVGPRRDRAIRWLEDNGFVDDSIGVLRWLPNRGWRRSEAAFLLGQMGSSKAAPALAAGLRDLRYRVRDACATALGRVATENEVPALIDAVEARKVPRGILSGALLHLDPAADPRLIDCLAHPDDATRELVARVLGMRRASRAIPALVATLEDPAPDVRRHAILAIAEIVANTDDHDAIDPEPLIRLAVDDQAPVRAAAATALGQILGDAAGRVLTSMTRDADYWVSYRAAESLCRLPSGAELGWAVLCDHDDTPGARRARSACLEWLERTGGIEKLMTGVLDRGSDVVLTAALEVLERVGSRAWGELLFPPAASVAEVAA